MFLNSAWFVESLRLIEVTLKSKKDLVTLWQLKLTICFGHGSTLF